MVRGLGVSPSGERAFAEGAPLPAGWTGKVGLSSTVAAGEGRFPFSWTNTTHASGQCVRRWIMRCAPARLVSAWPRLITIVEREADHPDDRAARDVLYPALARDPSPALHGSTRSSRDSGACSARRMASSCSSPARLTIGSVGTRRCAIMSSRTWRWDGGGGAVGEGMRLRNCESQSFSTCRIPIVPEV